MPNLEKYRNDPRYKVVPTKFGDETIDVIYRRLEPPYPRGAGETTSTRAGHVHFVSPLISVPTKQHTILSATRIWR